MAQENPNIREINTFRRPYDDLMTPYKEKYINISVSRFCRRANSETTLKNGKVIFIGNTGVGKTSLIRRFCHNKFNSYGVETVGVELYISSFNILGIPFNIEFCEAAGNGRYKWITTSYYRGSNVIVILFDLSDMKALRACEDWLDEAEYKNNHDFVFLVGNKMDTLTKEDYSANKEKIFPVAMKLKAEYWPVSAKTGKNVKNLFLRIALLSFQSVVLKEMGYAMDTSEMDAPESAFSLENNIEKAEQKESCSC